MISHKHKFIFVHIPKNAGSSINHELKGLCELTSSVLKRKSKDIPLAYGKHANDNHMRRLLKNEYGNYYKFCVVRNPWDRMVSIYWYELGKSIPIGWTFTRFLEGYNKLLRTADKGRRVEDKRAISWDYKNIIPKLSLKDLENQPEFKNIEREDITHESALYNTMKSQCKWIDSIKNKHEQNYVIVRYENLNTGMKTVYRDIGYESSDLLKHKNKRNKYNVSLVNKDMVDIHYRDMYSEEEVEIVRVLYRDDIERFGYKF
jgi:hypothetical protein